MMNKPYDRSNSICFRLSYKARILSVVFFFCFLCVNAQAVSFSKTSLGLKEFFNELHRQTGYNVLYENSVVRGVGSIKVSTSRLPLSLALDQSLSETSLTYTISGKTIYIKQKPVGVQHTSQVSSSMLSVTGKIVDDEGKPLPEVIIRVKGTSRAFRADLNGHFTVSAQVGDVLVFSFIGFNPVEHKVQNDKFLTIKMVQSAVSLGNVVVNGIFERKSGSYTGAATSLQSKDLRNVSNQNLLTSLAVLDPSIQITQNLSAGSDPNQAMDMRLRGASSLPTDLNVSDLSTSTIRSNQDYYSSYGKRVDQISNSFNGNPNLPLFILDGFEVTKSQVNDLDMTTIQNVTILKDASSTAIYGSRGANGVIVIERFKPQAGRTQFSYKADLTLNLADLSDYKLLNSEEKLYVENLAGIYSNSDPVTNQALKELYNDRYKEMLKGRNTDWLSLPVQNSVSQRHGFTMDGTYDKLGYGMDFTYNRNNGVMKGSNRESFNGGLYLRYKSQHFSLDNRLTLQFVNGTNSPWGTFSQYARMNPYFSPFDANGNIQLYLQRASLGLSNYVYSNIYNPVYNTTLNSKDFSKSQNLINNTVITYNVNQDLSVRGRLSLSNTNLNQEIFLPSANTIYRQLNTALLQRGEYTASYGKKFSYDANLDVNYNKSLGKHVISSTFSTRAYQNNYENVMIQVQGLPSPLSDYVFYGKNYKGDRPTGSEGTVRTLGFLGNLNYTYDRRFFADFSYRLDGSSSLGSDKLFAPFWSVGAGWNLHNEQFFRKHVESGLINQLRIRGSIGLTGSQQFDPYMAFRTYNYFLNEIYGASVGANLLSLGNNELKWQGTTKHNIGADISMFHNRLNINADYYTDNTDNFIASFSLPLSTGFESYMGNLGSIKSKGWELKANVQAVRGASLNSFSLNLFANVLNNETKIDKISDALKNQNKKLLSTTTTTSPFTRYEEGARLDALWVVRSLGIDPANGKELFQRKDGSVSYVWDPNDMVNVGFSNPKYKGAFGFTVGYAGFQLSSFFSYRLGGQAFNSTLLNRVENVNLVDNADRRVLADRWAKPGDISYFKGITVDGAKTNASSRFVQDDNTVDLTSMSLLYRVDPKFLKKYPVRQLNFGMYTSNLFRISSIQQERGLDYPFARNVSFSVQVGF